MILSEARAKAWQLAAAVCAVLAVAAVIVACPDLYQAAASLGLLNDQHVPETLAWGIRGLAGLGLAVKFIRQTKPA